MTTIDVIPVFIQAIFFISGLTFSFSLVHIGYLKDELQNAHKKYLKGTGVYIKNFEITYLLNPFLLFYVFMSIPEQKDNSEFYSIPLIKETYNELKSSYKAAVVGFSMICISVAGIFIYVCWIR